MKHDPDLEAKQDAWVERQLLGAPPLTLEAQALIRRLFGPQSTTQDQKSAPDPEGGTQPQHDPLDAA